MTPLSELPEAPTAEGQDVTHKSTIARFATLLGAFRLKKYPQNTKNNDGCLSTLFSSSSSASCSVPSLSLTSYHHHTEGGSHSHEETKQQVEEHAASNLARPIDAKPARGTDSTVKLQNVTDPKNTIGTTTTTTIHQLPLKMLDNLAASFLTLVDARLRAYITILARHGVSLSDYPALDAEEQREGVLAVERKLDTLLEVGSGVAIENMVAFFRITEQPEEEQKDGGVRMPLVMETTFDVAIPEVAGGGTQLVTVAAAATGNIEAFFDADGKMLTRVHVEVDTHELLAQLIDRASLVMSVALDIVVAVSALPPHVPPAPLPKHEQPLDHPKPKPVEAQVSLAIVSPEMSTNSSKRGCEPPPLELEETSTTEDLSPESCANIVDFVIGEVNHIIFPPLKRLKTA